MWNETWSSNGIDISSKRLNCLSVTFQCKILKWALPSSWTWLNKPENLLLGSIGHCWLVLCFYAEHVEHKTSGSKRFINAGTPELSAEASLVYRFKTKILFVESNHFLSNLFLLNWRCLRSWCCSRNVPVSGNCKHVCRLISDQIFRMQNKLYDCGESETSVENEFCLRRKKQVQHLSTRRQWNRDIAVNVNILGLCVSASLNIHWIYTGFLQYVVIY